MNADIIPHDIEKLTTYEGVAEALFDERARPSRRKLERLVADNVIPSVLVGQRRYFSLSQVREALFRGIAAPEVQV